MVALTFDGKTKKNDDEEEEEEWRVELVARTVKKMKTKHVKRKRVARGRRW